jgi:antitoxin (DNA-binding transcriptional repressor) of toxin-antitoxin stability system
VIARSGVPVAKLIAVEARPKRLLGIDAGLLEVPDDFDAPLPRQILDGFER